MDDRPRSLQSPGAQAGTDDLQAPLDRSDGRHWTDEDQIEDFARQEIDWKLLEELAADDFTDSVYAVLEEALAAYGYQVVLTLLSTGYIFARCHEINIELVIRPILETDYEDLAQETTAGALGAFKKKVMQGNGWRPDGRASLKTYFSRGLLYQFANVWRGHLRTGAAEALPLDEAADIRSSAPSPEDLLVQQDLIHRGLADVPNEKTRVALALTEDGFDQEEIAEILGITKRAVEGLLRRHRERIAAMADEDRR